MISIKHLPRSDLEEAQGLVEYALILALVAIVVIVVLGAFGQTLQDSYYCILGALEGSSTGRGGGMTLIDPTTDIDVEDIACGTTYSKSELGMNSFNIRANVSGSEIGSVIFVMEGPYNHTQPENLPEYALFGNTGSNYNGNNFAVGSYRVVATVYTGSGGSGSVITRMVATFNVVD